MCAAHYVKLNNTVQSFLLLSLSIGVRSTRTIIQRRRTMTSMRRSPAQKEMISLEATSTRGEVKWMTYIFLFSTFLCFNCAIDFDLDLYMHAYWELWLHHMKYKNSLSPGSSRPSVTHSSSSGGDADQKRVRTKLMKFLLKRPTLQSVKDKGYIRGIDKSFFFFVDTKQTHMKQKCEKCGIRKRLQMG